MKQREIVKPVNASWALLKMLTMFNIAEEQIHYTDSNDVLLMVLRVLHKIEVNK